MHGSAYYITVPTQSADSRSMYVRTTVPSSWSRTVGLGLRHTNYCQPQVSSQPTFPEQQQYSGTNSCSIPYQPTAMHAPLPMQSNWPQVYEPHYNYQPNMTVPSALRYNYQQQYSIRSSTCSSALQSSWPQVFESHYGYQPNMAAPYAQHYDYQQQQQPGTVNNSTTKSFTPVPGPMSNATNMPYRSYVQESQPHQDREEVTRSTVFPAFFQQILARAREDFESFPTKFSENQRQKREENGEEKEYLFGPSNSRRVSSRPTAFRPHFGTLSYTIKFDGDDDESDAGYSSQSVESQTSSLKQTIECRGGSLSQAIES
ncbi:MAG: hypothetical protein J3R72DRAFT_516853 [Linnemannia gamsii]|nr:MAG: hypothetical protein J3R72DRAFT_516853 [Linnemannia gamsii]